MKARLLFILFASGIIICAWLDPFGFFISEPPVPNWPLSAESRHKLIHVAEEDRRPGSNEDQHLPHLWPVVATAGHTGGDKWIREHEQLVEQVQARLGPVDVLLVGDSITKYWRDAWTEEFPETSSINIGIGGDKTQNVLWRLQHAAVDGLEPRVILLMVGNNNMFLTPKTGIDAASEGIRLCVNDLHKRFPNGQLILANILPGHEPGNRFYEDIKRTNARLDSYNLSSEPNIHRLDLWASFTNSNGDLKSDLYLADRVHLSRRGYEVYAAQLRPRLKQLLVL